MKMKKVAGFALLLSVIVFGAFISGCINQGNTTRETTTPTTATPKETTTSTVSKETPTSAPTETLSQDDLKADEEKLKGLIELYDKEIVDAKEKLGKLGLEVKSSEIENWEKSAEILSEMVANESDIKRKVYLLQNLAQLKYYEILNLRALVEVGAVETSYWENATTGEPIEGFYNMRGDFFYTENGKTLKMDSAKMAEQMHSLLKGYELESVEIYHPGTGSVLRSIREGGRTVSAGQVAIHINARDGMKIKVAGRDLGVLRMVDPNTGETVMKVSPDENGIYTVPPVNTTLLGIADDGGFCYRPLPLDENYMELMPITDEVTLDEVLCAGAQIAPFVFDPTDYGTGPYDPAPMEELYLMPGQYTLQTLVMKADLKQLAEQLVNVNVRMGGTKVEARDAKKALDAFQNAITSVEASVETPAEACSCTFSPLLNGIFRETFGGPFEEVPAMKDINITDFGNGPFIPEVWKGMEESSAEIRLYVITSANGETLILLEDSGPTTLRADYLDRVYVEVFTGRNPQTGKEIKVAAFKVLNTDGTIAVRETLPIKASSVRLVVLPSKSEP